MRKLTITLLFIVAIIVTACASQPQAVREGEPKSAPQILRSTWNDERTGTRVETTHKIWGPMPRCDESRPAGVPCEGAVKRSPAPTEKPRKLTVGGAAR